MWSLLAAALCTGLVFGQSGNPYLGKTVYVQQTYVAEVQTSIDAHPSQAALLKKYQNVPVFYWIDSMARIANLTVVLDGAVEAAKQNNTKMIVQIIVYDVPDRDCSALASNGEIVCEDSSCAQGIQTYQTKYIDPIYNLLSQSKYSDLTIVALIEPDSLPNLATNLNVAKCQQAQTAYMTAIPYAIKKLASLPNVVQYVDAAHGGWLGWPDNMQKFTQIIKTVLESAGMIYIYIYISTYTSIRKFAIGFDIDVYLYFVFYILLHLTFNMVNIFVIFVLLTMHNNIIKVELIQYVDSHQIQQIINL